MIYHDGKGVYCEYLNEDDNKWHLTRLPMWQAILCKICIPKEFYFVKEKNLIFEEAE